MAIGKPTLEISWPSAEMSIIISPLYSMKNEGAPFPTGKDFKAFTAWGKSPWSPSQHYSMTASELCQLLVTGVYLVFDFFGFIKGQSWIITKFTKIFHGFPTLPVYINQTVVKPDKDFIRSLVSACNDGETSLNRSQTDFIHTPKILLVLKCAAIRWICSLKEIG